MFDYQAKKKIIQVKEWRCLLCFLLVTLFQLNRAAERSALLPGASGSTRGHDLIMKNEENGWKNVHVFAGDDRYLIKKRGKSQCMQDDLILALLFNKENGYFVDLAANDPVSLSNTFKLEQVANWKGICIEANPAYWRPLSYRACHVVGAVIGESRMEEVRFKFHEGTRRLPSGGIERADFDNTPNHPKTESKTVPLLTVPLQEILQRLNAPKVIDYFSLDVEGAESFIMNSFPFEEYRFRLLTVERPKQDLVDILYEHNYRYLAAFNKFGDETVWAHVDDLPALNLTAISSIGWIENDTNKMKIGGSPDQPPKVITTIK